MGKKKTCKKTIMGAKVSENSDIPDDVKEAAENLELGASSGKIQTDISRLKRHGGWRSTSVAEGYMEQCIEEKKHCP
jgi:hypothetical protein